MQNKKYDFLCVSRDLYFSGVGVLDPRSEKHYYEDDFADGYVKAVAIYCGDGIEQYSKVTRHKIKYGKTDWSDEKEPYFIKYSRRYYLSDMPRVNY